MKWKLFPQAPAGDMSFGHDIPPLLAQFLYNRGIRDSVAAGEFLAIGDGMSHDPLLLADIGKAVARITRAVLRGETIAVFGDFDADGITSSALLVQGITMMGGKVISHIPHRVNEGHGLNQPALEKLIKQGVSLVITVDCGITANTEAKWMIENGLDLIITDHHEVIGTIPPAIAAVNPKRADSNYPFRELAGVGVAFKLLEALYKATGREQQIDEFLDLVAIGTVADMVPLQGENRYLVKRGLEVLNRTNRIGLIEMVNLTKLKLGQIDSEGISFVLSPRLNAAGRLDHASISYDLLIANSAEAAEELAQILEQRNSERQELTARLVRQAEDKILPVDKTMPLLMIACDDFHAGVNGVVAGKLTNKYYRPTLILEVGENDSRGSARSIAEFNIVSALTECRDILVQFGGHAQAAGFVVLNENLDRLRMSLLDIAARELAHVDLTPTIDIDAEVALGDLGGETYNLVKRLEPFGKGNPNPIFFSRNVEVINYRHVGKEGEHLSLKLRDGGNVWDAIGFDIQFPANATSRLDIVYSLRLDRWNGREQLRLEIHDVVPVGEAPIIS